MEDHRDSPVVTVTASPPSAHHQPGVGRASTAVYTYERVPDDACNLGLKDLSNSDEALVTTASLSSPSASAESAASLGESRQSIAPSLPGYSSAPRPESRESAPSSTKSASPSIRAAIRNDSAAAELRSIKTGLSASAPPATSPVSLLSLRSPSNFLDSHSTTVPGGVGAPFNAGIGSGNNFSWSPTTTMFFGPKSNGLPSARFSAFKREHFDASPITPSLYTNSGTTGNDGQHSYYSGSSRFGNIIDGSGPTSNHHTDWNVQTTSWTGLPTPSSEAVLKSMAGSGINHVHSSLHVESSSWDHLGSNSLVLHSASQKMLDGNAANGNATLLGGHVSPAMFRTGGCANGMLPPTPRTVLSGVTNSRAVPRSAGFSWLYQDMAMPSFNSSSNSNAVDQFPNLGRPSAGSGNHSSADHHLHQEHQQQHGNSGGHVFNFSPPQTTLGRPPLSARAPRLRPNGMDSGVNAHGNDWQSEHGHNSHDGSSSSVHAHSPDGSEVGDGGAAAARYHARVNATYATDEAKWMAVQSRDARASASFFYCVLSTKIFCRTTCPSRRPVRENICFVNSPAEANALGYRACKRCKPDVRGGDPHEARQEILIAKVKERLLQGVLDGGKGKAVKGKGLKYIAEDLGVSHWHLHRCFKKRVNQTPEAWAKAQAKKLRGTHRDDELVVERADSRSSVGAHSVASSSSVLTTGLRGEGSSSQHHHHRHHSLHAADHYGSSSRSTEMIPFGH